MQFDASQTRSLDFFSGLECSPIFLELHFGMFCNMDALPFSHGFDIVFPFIAGSSPLFLDTTKSMDINPNVRG